MHEARQGEQESGSRASLDGTSMGDWTKREGLGHQDLQEAGGWIAPMTVMEEGRRRMGFL